jgi:prepilin-type N-terminal cleavage/methylation domain-containing protein/prepilin-type processing-associated H-X9-DG protein
MWNNWPLKRFKLASFGAKGFTMVELCVVITLLAVLATLAVPAFSCVEGASRVAQCAGNLRQLTLAAEIYAYEYRNALPNGQAGFWASHWPIPTSNLLLNSGATRNNFYCPAHPELNANSLWFEISYRVAGYAQTFVGAGGVFGTNVNYSILSGPISFGPIHFDPPRASSRVLFADVTISMPGQANPDPAIEATYQWSGIPGADLVPGLQGYRTAHLIGWLPAGGNVAMLDGHVEWRAFSQMIGRSDLNGTTPVFWW